MAKVYSLKVTLRYAQARRIECEHCNQVYSFVHGGTTSGSVSEGAMFHDENEMRRAAFREAANELDSLSEREQQGRGRCPHCHRLQDWMRVTAGMAIAGFAALSLVVGGIVGFAATYFLESTIAWSVGGGLAAVGVLLSVLFGGKAADSADPVPIHDPYVKTDEQLLEFIEESSRLHQDPFLRWWKAADKPLIAEREKNTIEFPMGLLDQAKAPLALPEALTSKARSAALIRLDA